MIKTITIECDKGTTVLKFDSFTACNPDTCATAASSDASSAPVETPVAPASDAPADVPASNDASTPIA